MEIDFYKLKKVNFFIIKSLESIFDCYQHCGTLCTIQLAQKNPEGAQRDDLDKKRVWDDTLYIYVMYC